MFDQFCELYGVAGTFEQFPAAPGSRWRMTGYGLSPVQVLGSPASAFGIIQVTFFDAQGNDLGTVETTGAPFPAKTSVHIDATTTPLEWQFLDTETVTAPAGAAYIQAFTLWIDYTGQGSCQGVYFDDLQLEVLVSNHGQYVSSIARNAAALVAAGLITQTQAVAMVEAAASSMGGK
jgi:hypothetical protein